MSETMMDAIDDNQEGIETIDPIDQQEANQENDVWAEDFDMDDIPTVEDNSGDDVTEDDSIAVESTIEDDDAIGPEYITHGLGELDSPLVVKVKGEIYDLKDLDQIRDLVERGFMATQKTQELADMRRQMEMEKNPGLTPDDYIELEAVNEVEQLSQEIISNGHGEMASEALSLMDQGDLEKISRDPSMMRALIKDLDSGVLNAIMPSLKRSITIDGMSFQQAYVRAVTSAMEKQEQRDVSQQRMAAEPRGGYSMDQKVTDPWDISTEEFNGLMSTRRK